MRASYDFLELAADRYSVRKFTTEPVARETLDKILQAGHLAPTACNLQPQRIVVLDDADALAKLRTCTACHFHAPAALIVCYDKTLCWKREFDGKTSGDIDASIVTTHMMLMAASLGIGSTWVMFFEPDKLKSAFAIPDQLEPVALLMLGHPAPDAAPYPGHSTFRPAEEIVSYNKF